MQTKLTLTIERSTIEKAKEYARTKHKSVSKIVEDYLRNISRPGVVPSSPAGAESPITDSLVGMFQDDGKDYDSMLDEARMDRYR